MRTRFRADSSPRAGARPDGGTVADHLAEGNVYLTDGVSLYRCLGPVAGAMGQMVELEDCRSLDVVLLPIGALRSRRLRTVVPAAQTG